MDPRGNQKTGGKMKKAVGETKSIRIYPMKDNTDGVMWEIHPPKECQEKFGEKIGQRIRKN